jgi:hypothetical protein
MSRWIAFGAEVTRIQKHDNHGDEENLAPSLKHLTPRRVIAHFPFAPWEGAGDEYPCAIGAR